MISTAATEQLDAEVLVVGSGAGGATTAAVLAEAGFDVLIVEEGEWIDQGEVVPFSLEQMDRQYRSGGVTVALGLPSIAYTEGRCAGGGTEINSGLYRRPPDEVLQRWAADYRIADLDHDEIATIAPPPERARWTAECLIVKNAPVRLAPMTLFQSSRVVRCSGAAEPVPALATTYPDDGGLFARAAAESEAIAAAYVASLGT